MRVWKVEAACEGITSTQVKNVYFKCVSQKSSRSHDAKYYHVSKAQALIQNSQASPRPLPHAGLSPPVLSAAAASQAAPPAPQPRGEAPSPRRRALPGAHRRGCWGRTGPAERCPDPPAPGRLPPPAPRTRPWRLPPSPWQRDARAGPHHPPRRVGEGTSNRGWARSSPCSTRPLTASSLPAAGW